MLNLYAKLHEVIDEQAISERDEHYYNHVLQKKNVNKPQNATSDLVKKEAPIRLL